MTGGKGLDGDLSTAKVDARGKVVTADATKAVGEILAMLEDPKAPQTEFISDVPTDFKLSSDPEGRVSDRKLRVSDGSAWRMRSGLR